jgi:hypothetical protein
MWYPQTWSSETARPPSRGAGRYSLWVRKFVCGREPAARAEARLGTVTLQLDSAVDGDMVNLDDTGHRRAVRNPGQAQEQIRDRFGERKSSFRYPLICLEPCGARSTIGTHGPTGSQGGTRVLEFSTDAMC